MKIQYNRNRYYDYYTGRWLTHDPLGITPNPQKPNVFYVIGGYAGGINLYQYVNSNPMIIVDPHGLKWCCDKCVGGEKDYEVIDEIIVPHDFSSKHRRAMSLVSTGSAGVDIALKKYWLIPNMLIIDVYMASIWSSYMRSLGVDLYLRIQEKKCVKRRCWWTLWRKKRYEWKKTKKYDHKCTSGKFVAGLAGGGRYLDWDDAKDSVPKCKKLFEASFDHAIDPFKAFLFLWGCQQP